MITKRLLDVCDFQGGTQPPKEEWINDPREGYVRMLQIRDYSQGDAKFIQYVKDTKKLHKCKKDDIMLSRYGYIGQAFMGLEGAYNVALVKVIKKEEIHTPYLLYYFQSYYFQHFLLSNVGARATIPGFNKDELENALIRLPEMREQVEIASKIAKVDELIGYHKQQLDILDALIKSRFIEMFGDVKDEEKVTLSDICLIITDGTHQPPKFTTTGIPFLFVSNIVGNTITYDAEKFISQETYAELIKRTPIEIGDVLLSTVGSYGHPAVVKSDKPFCFQRHIAYLKPNKELIDSEYLHGAILSVDVQKQIEERVKGIAQKTLNLSEIRKIKLPLPRIDEQKQFAAFVEQVDKSKFYIIQTQKIIELLIRAIQYTTKEVLL